MSAETRWLWSSRWIAGCLCSLTLLGFVQVAGAADSIPGTAVFPPLLDSYQDTHLRSVGAILWHRIQVEPFNLLATVMFLGAVIHTFLTPRFRHWAHHLEVRHRERAPRYGDRVLHVSVPARLLHFLGEVEAVFGIWAVPVFFLMWIKFGFGSPFDYIDHRIGFTEPIFVVVIMTIASSQPVLRLAENSMRILADLGGGRTIAWWLAILTLGPLLGSFITEPGAMTISASLLARQFYVRKPRPAFAYATLGLLFVNISVGGTLTHFAAPPVLMVAGHWQWDTLFMLRHFGLGAATGIVISNLLYLIWFRKDFALLATANESGENHTAAADRIPRWVSLGHIVFLIWAVLCAHHPRLLFFCLLFFIAFFEVTEDYQGQLGLRPAVLVGFFLAGLVFHGGLQQWWIAPVLGSLSEMPLFLGATFLTSFNDNAAITYLSTLVPNLSDGMKHAVVAGAVTGGGLTVIANAPNPAGQSILDRFFPEGISPLGLFLGAAIPTAVVGFCLTWIR
jgi:hypothetical protein